MALVFRVCAVQGAVALIAALLAGVFSGAAGAAAALFGGVAAALPTLVFGWRVSLPRPGATAQEVLGAFYRGELIKVVLTVLLFAAGAALFGQHFLPLILTYSACLFAYWIAAAAGW